MEHANVRIIEEVRNYAHLYNASSPHYKDSQMSNNSWLQISRDTGMEVTECMKRWKNLRDKYVRLRKKLAEKGLDPEEQKVPAYYPYLAWLAPHVRHRWETEPNNNNNNNNNNEEHETPTVTPPKRKKVQQEKPKRASKEDWFVRQMETQEERRMELQLQQKMLQGMDECARFGQTVADLLRRVPEDERPDVMFRVYSLIHDSKK